MNQIIFAMLVSFLLSSQVFAEDRALIIGVGRYENPQYNLMGVENDVSTMLETANLMGFKAIKVLQNEQVTKENLEKTVQSWLVNEVTAQDRVLIYFSGHGAIAPDNNGDEAEGIDEVLATYTVNVVTKKTGNSLDGVIRDDDMTQLLSKIPSHNILVLLDACHSATATRALSQNMVSKALRYEGMPGFNRTRALSTKLYNPLLNAQKSYIVTLSAANDDEESLSTLTGSVFTIGFNAVLKQALLDKKTLTPLEITRKVNDFIQKKLEKTEYKPFHPQLSGDESLLNSGFILTGVQEPTKLAALTVTDGVAPPKAESAPKISLWSDLSRLVKKTPPLDILASQIVLKEGENLTLEINSKQSGYLYIVTVDANDVATLLFPNQNHLDNAVSAGEFDFPTLKSGFKLTTQAPFGRSMLVALISQEKLELFTDEKKATRPLLKTLSRWDIKNLFRVATSAGKVEVLSCAKGAKCQ